MNTQEIIDKLDKMKLFGAADLIRQQQQQIDKLASSVALREMEIKSLKDALKTMRVNADSVLGKAQDK